MSKVLLVSASPSLSVAASTTRDLGICGNMRNTGHATESRATQIWRSAGTLSNMLIQVLTNDRAASTLTIRKSTADGNQTISITGSTTGKFEDTSNTDTVSAGDNFHARITTGAGGTVFTFVSRMMLFDASSNTVYKLGTNGATTYNVASTTYFTYIAGGFAVDSAAAEDDREVPYRTAGTLKNLHVYCFGHASTNPLTFRSRVNNADGNLTVSVNATGSFEDVANSDTISVDDTIDFTVVTGAGTVDSDFSNAIFEFLTTDDTWQFTTAGNSAKGLATGQTLYFVLAGANDENATETNTLVESNLAFTSSKLQCTINNNTISDNSTLRLRINEGNGSQVVSITGSTDGVFQDISNTDVIIETDTLDYQLITGATGTTLDVETISTLADSTVTGAVATGIMTPRSGYWGDL